MAVDRLLQHIQDHDELDVFNLVLEMRTYRCRMVQTEVRGPLYVGGGMNLRVKRARSYTYETYTHTNNTIICL